MARLSVLLICVAGLGSPSIAQSASTALSAAPVSARDSSKTVAGEPVTGEATASPGGDNAVPAALSDYTLGIADKVRIIVFNEETLSGEFTVSDSGTLSLPLIGSIVATGRTPVEITKDIEKKLADGYLREPRVSIDVLTYRPFYILGEVTKPGEYPYSSGLTIYNAVARASGFTYRANKRKIYIKRTGETLEHEYKLTPDVQILPGDTVRVGERFF